MMNSENTSKRDQLNAEFLDWLDNEGNGMINETTKKSPRELFKKEYKKLIKIKEKISLIRLQFISFPHPEP